MNLDLRTITSIASASLLIGCSQSTKRTGSQHNPPQVIADSKQVGAATHTTLAPYPYTLFLGSSAYHVEQEPENGRLLLQFSKWSDSQDGGRDAVFRVTNRGSKPVLVWNVRQQIKVSNSNGVATGWQNHRNDYPGRGWDHPMIPAGGSEEFPISPDSEEHWRVCLLYSRERSDSQPSNRLFDGTFECIGPSMRGTDSPQAQPAAGANRE